MFFFGKRGRLPRQSPRLNLDTDVPAAPQRPSVAHQKKKKKSGLHAVLLRRTESEERVGYIYKDSQMVGRLVEQENMWLRHGQRREDDTCLLSSRKLANWDQVSRPVQSELPKHLTKPIKKKHT